MSEENVDYEIDDEQEEMVQISKEDWEAIVETIEAMDDDLSIEEKIDRSLLDNRALYIHGEINQEVSQQIIPMIHYFNVVDEGIPVEDREPLKLFISSEGGEAYKGYNLISAIERSKTPVHTYSEGTQLMSMGLLIFLSGDVRHMSRHSSPMYHQIAAGTSGSISTMENETAYYRRMQEQAKQYIAERTSIPIEKMEEYDDKNLDWFLTFEECKRYKVFDIEI